MTGQLTNAQRNASKPWLAEHAKRHVTKNPLRLVSQAGPGHRSGAPKVTNDLRPSELLSLFQDHAFEQQFQPDSTVLLHGNAADAMYLVTSGTVRCCTIGDDGSRQIFCFATKGDFIGLSDIDTWHFTAEAVDHVILKSIPRNIVERHLRSNMRLREEFRVRITQLLERREKQLLSLISKKAPDRLFRFLCDFASSRPGKGHGAVALPMCRRDLADHLGLSVETVSRAFTHLKTKERIELLTYEKYRIPHQVDRDPSEKLTSDTLRRTPESAA